MSQQTNAGFNAPGFAVGSGEPDAVGPCATTSTFSGLEFRFHCEGPAVLLESCTVGVAHIAISTKTIWPNVSPNPFPLPCFSCIARFRSMSFCGSPPSYWFAVGVGHIAYTTLCKDGLKSALSLPACLFALGVGHKPQSVSTMGRIDGTSRDNGRPCGVTDAFQVSRHSVEPRLANRCRNLLSHNDRGAAGSDEVEEDRPEVPFVLLRGAFACDGEWLAGGASGPDGPVVRPPCESEGVPPPADSGEEVALGEGSKVIRCHIDD